MLSTRSIPISTVSARGSGTSCRYRQRYIAGPEPSDIPPGTGLLGVLGVTILVGRLTLPIRELRRAALLVAIAAFAIGALWGALTTPKEEP